MYQNAKRAPPRLGLGERSDSWKTVRMSTFSYDDANKAPAPASGVASSEKQGFSFEDAGGEAPTRGFGGWARDIGGVAINAAISVPEVAVGVADIATNLGATALGFKSPQVGKRLEDAGLRFKEAKEFVNENIKSDASREARRKFQEAEGIGGKFQAAIENPSLIAEGVGESLGPIGTGGVVARGFMGAAKAGLLGRAAAGAADTTKAAVMAGAAGEGAVMAGSQAEAIRQETEDGMLTPGQAGAAVATGVIGGGLGFAGAKLANKLGVGDADTMLAQGAAGIAKQNADEAAAAALMSQKAKSIPRQVVEGAIAEGFLEELPQSVAETVIKNLALDKPWSEGLDEAIVMGVLSGGAMGGAAAGYKGFTAPKAKEQDPNAPAPEQAPVNPGVERMREALALPAPTITVGSDGQAMTAADRNARLQRIATGDATDITPVRETLRPSEAMGLNPNAGGLTGAAALAVDSGAHASVQQQFIDPDDLPDAGIDAPAGPMAAAAGAQSSIPTFDYNNASPEDRARYEADIDAEAQAWEMSRNGLDAEAFASIDELDDSDIPLFDQASNTSDEDFLRALGASDEEINDAIQAANQPASAQSRPAGNAQAQANESRGAGKSTVQGQGAAQVGQQQALPTSPADRIAELEAIAAASDAKANKLASTTYKPNPIPLPEHAAKGGPATIGEANEQYALKTIGESRATAKAARDEIASLQDEANAHAQQATKAPSVAGLAAIARKTIPDMTDSELLALTSSTASSHARFEKLQKAVQSRGLQAQVAIKEGAKNDATQTTETQQAGAQQQAARAASGQAINGVSTGAAAQAGPAAKQGGVNGGSTNGNDGSQANQPSAPIGTENAQAIAREGNERRQAEHQRKLEASERWTRMSTVERQAAAQHSSGLSKIAKGNVHKKPWADLSDKVRASLLDAVAPQTNAQKVAANTDQTNKVPVNGVQTNAQQSGEAIKNDAVPPLAQQGDKHAPWVGKDIDAEWAEFSKESGTKGIPRAQMPQIKAVHRGAMTNFMNARGVKHEEQEVAADTLKPTQAEFSKVKVARAKDAPATGRSVLVSKDGYVLDGHHQWMGALENSEKVKVIRLDADIDQLLMLAHEFPNSTVASGALKAGKTKKSEAQGLEAADTVDSSVQGQGVALFRASGVFSANQEAGTAGLSLEQAQKAVKEALGGLRSAPPVNVVGRSAELGISAPDGVMGAMIPSEGRIVLVASAHTSDLDVVETLFHEMFHLGLRNVLPSSDYVQVLLDLAKRDARVLRYAIDWKKNAPDAPLQLQALRDLGYVGGELTAQYEALAIEEGLAVVAQELAARKLPGTAQTLRVRQLAGWFAGVAQRMGMTRLAAAIRKLTYNDAERFVMKAIDAAARGTDARTSMDAMYRTLSSGERSEGGAMRGLDLAQAMKVLEQSQAGMSAQMIAQVNRVVDGIRKTWVNAPEVVVAYGMEDAKIPKEALATDSLQRSEGAEGDPEGFYWEGKVYLLADMLHTPNDVARVFFHEALGHHGLRGTFGKQLDEVLEQITVMRKADVAAKLTQYGLKNTAKGRRVAVEEVLAEMAQATPEIGFVKRAIAAIRTWLRAHVPGFHSLKLTDAEIIRSYILPAREWVERGGPDGPRGGHTSAPTMSRGNQDMFAAEIMSELATVDELFMNPRAHAGSAEAALRQLDPSIVYVGDVTAVDERAESGADSKLLFRTANGQDFFVFEKGDELWLDVSRLDEGGGGNTIYAALMDYAAGNEKVFVGDPAGLSDIAMRRRLEAMLSSAIKHGGTDHMQPHERQMKGDAKLGMPALRWRDGDTIGNIQRMIDVSLASIKAHVPEFQRARYDFATGAFRDSKGAAIPDEVLDAWAEHPRMRAAGVGSRSIKRGIFLNTLAHAESGQRPGLLEQTLRQPGQLVGPQAEGIFYSRAKVLELKDKGLKLAHTYMSHPGKVSVWDKTVGTMRHLAERNPAFKPVFEAAQQFIDDVSTLANEAANMAPRLLPRVETLGDMLGKQRKKPINAIDNAAIAKALFGGTLDWGRDQHGKVMPMDALKAKYEGLNVHQKAEVLMAAGKVQPNMMAAMRAKPIEHFETFINNKFNSALLKPGATFNHKELIEHFKLTPLQISLYDEARAVVEKSLDITARAEMLRNLGKDWDYMRGMVLDAPTLTEAWQLLDTELENHAKQYPDQRDRMADLMHSIETTRNKVAELVAHGYMPLQRFGKYTLLVQDATGESLFFGMYETKAESNTMAAKLRTEFPKEKIIQGTMSDQRYKLMAGITPETAEMFGSMLGLDSKGNEEKDKAFQEFLKLAKNNGSALKRLIHRKGTAGYSEDVGRVMASFVYANARLSAAGLNAGRMDEAINQMDKEGGELIDVAMKLRSYIQDPQEEGQAIRGMLFAQYLGGSIASALVNMTQPFAVTLPWLSQFGGMVSASRFMSGALKDMTQSAMNKGFKYEAGLAVALQKAEDDGVVSPQEIHMLMAQARGAGGLRAGDGTKAGDARAELANSWTKLKVGWGMPFALAEQFNRRSTFIAAFRLAEQQKMANPAEFARKAVLETQFLYTKANKPQWARGAVGGTLFTFKTYSVSFLELMQRTWNAGEPGSPERAAGRRAVAWAMLMLMLMGGAGGLPFVEDAEDLIDGLGQMMGYNVSTKQWRQEAMRNLMGAELAEFMEAGLSGLPGAPIDVSGRLGMGNLIPGTGLLLSKQSNTRDLTELVGPAGDLISRGFSGGKQALQGLVTGDAAAMGRGAMEVMPNAVRNAAKGVDMGVRGIYTDTKGRKVMDVSLDEAIAKFIGFQPRAVAQDSEAAGFQMRAKAFYTQTSSEIRAAWADALFRKDETGVQRARERLERWNANNPDMKIIIKMPDIWQRVRNLGKDRAQRITDTAPTGIRNTLKEWSREQGR